MIIRNALIIILSIVPSFSTLAALIAHVDKSTIGTGDSFTLTIEFDGHASSAPSFSALEQDFAILSTQMSRSQSFSGGVFSVKTSWSVLLTPQDSNKRTLEIPSLSLNGEKTQPITITQDEGVARNESAPEISLNVVSDKLSAYVNAEILITVTIKTALVLQNGSLTDLTLSDAIVESLGEDRMDKVVENGTLYYVVTRKYAVFPSKPGTLTIPPFVFRAAVAKNRNSRFGFGFMPPREEVRQRSREFSITVNDVPASFPKDQPFLPLKSFAVIESFDEASPDFRVNKAISRRFEMRAKGTLPAFLPTITLPSVKNLQIYDETGQKEKTVEEDGLLAAMKISHVYMPTAPGTIVVPEQTIYWWDTEHDVQKTTVIRALDLNVTGDGAVVTPPSGAEKPEVALDEPAASEETKPTSMKWWYIGSTLVVVWMGIVVLLVVVRKRRRALPKVYDSKEQELKDRARMVVVACESKDPKQVYERMRSLRSWLLKQDQGEQVSLVLAVSMNSLEQLLYTRNKMENLDEVMAAIKKQAKTLSFGTEHEEKLAPLYPN